MGQLPHPSIWGAPPLVWMISQYLSYICTLEGDAYGTNFPLLYFVINIFMMKIDAYGEFVSSVATHKHYASILTTCDVALISSARLVRFVLWWILSTFVRVIDLVWCL